MRTRVTGVPGFVEAARLLGPGPWVEEGDAFTAELAPDAAAEVQARLRGVVLAGRALAVTTEPPLHRPLVRRARLEDARRRRETSPGFSRPGARLDEEGRWSLTPEALALALGREARGALVLDACCGCGGNAIGFARAGCRVVAVDTDAGRLGLARHNAALYGVADRIHFVHGRAEDHAAGAGAALWFVDPPWLAGSGPTVEGLPPAGALLALPHPAVWLKVPPAFDPEALPGAAARAWFGAAAGDAHRVKFLVLRVAATGTPPSATSAR